MKRLILNNDLSNKLDVSRIVFKPGISSTNSPKVEFNWTGTSMVIIYYTNYIDGTHNYGHQLVLQENKIRYDAVENGSITTIWTINT